MICIIHASKEIKELIRKKNITINGEIINKSDLKINPELDIIKVFNNEIKVKKNIYLVFSSVAV